MPSIQSIIKELSKDYKDINFLPSDLFTWSKKNYTLTYINNDDLWPMLIHEIAHYDLNHTNYTNAIDLLRIERDAWDRAKLIAQNYQLIIEEEIIEKSIDSYRDWVHGRSKCVYCESIGIEINKNYYFCLNCENNWKVNEAKTCGIKRYKLPDIK